MKHQNITESVLFALYMGAMLALVGGLTYKVVRDYRQEKTQKIEKQKKQNLQSCVYLNQLRQK